VFTLITLLFWAVLLLLIIGLFSPNASLFWYKKERTKKRSALIYGVSAFVLLVMGAFTRPMSEAGGKEPYAQVSTQEPERADIPSATKAERNTIPGIMPVDIYQNFEKNGFTTKKDFGEFGNSWENEKEQAGINYSVRTYSTNVNDVESINATARIQFESNKAPAAALWFFKYVATLPYTNSDPERAIQWLGNHYNKKRDSVIIGSVKITIHSPSPYIRMLEMEKVI
jgi:hypothetical protein